MSKKHKLYANHESFLAAGFARFIAAHIDSAYRHRQRVDYEQAIGEQLSCSKYIFNGFNRL